MDEPQVVHGEKKNNLCLGEDWSDLFDFEAVDKVIIFYSKFYMIHLLRRSNIGRGTFSHLSGSFGPGVTEEAS